MNFHERDDYIAALNWVAEVMACTPSQQLSLPTPCAEYDVRNLMGHLIGTAERGLATAERRSTRPIPHVVTDVPDEKLAMTYASLAERIGNAWASLTRAELVRAPWGECSALEAAQGFTVETVTHGWDLTVATGRASDALDGVAARCLHVAESVIPSRLRGVMYADPVAADDTTSATEQLANLLGHRRA